MTVTALPPDVRAGQRLSPEQLLKAARDVVASSGLTQAEVAERIGSSQPSVGAALGHDFEARGRMLAKIIGELSDEYEVDREQVVTYRVKRKA